MDALGGVVTVTTPSTAPVGCIKLVLRIWLLVRMGTLLHIPSLSLSLASLFEFLKKSIRHFKMFQHLSLFFSYCDELEALSWEICPQDCTGIEKRKLIQSHEKQDVYFIR